MAKSPFGVEFDGEFGDYHVCDYNLPDETTGGDRNSLCDTKDRDRAFRVVEHLEKRHHPPYSTFVRADGTTGVMATNPENGSLYLLIVVEEQDRAGRLLTYLSQ